MVQAGGHGRLLSALLLSALVHLLAGGGIPWPRGQPETLPVPPIDARLEAPSPPVAGQRPETPRPRPAAASPARMVTPLASADDQARVETPMPATPEPQPETPLAPLPSGPEPGPPSPPVPLHPQLPSGFTVRYVVQGNEGGLVFGRLEHIWQRSEERYSLFALAKASGLMGLIYPGLLSQTSYGRIMPEGLQPENYWMQRGNRQLKAHFDWGGLRADLGERYPPIDLKPGSQDLLSVIYQLALFPHSEGELWVLDGKAIKAYRLEALGMETVKVPLGTVRTRHLRIQSVEGPERIDVWLRDSPPHLPMKIHMQGSRYGSAVLLAEAIRGLDPALGTLTEESASTE